MIQDVLKKVVIWSLIYLATFFGIQRYSETETLRQTFNYMGMWFYPLMWSYIFVVFGICWREKEWFQLSKRFNSRFSGTLTTEHVAIGHFELSEEQVIWVVSLAVEEGLLIMKPKRKLRARHAFLIRWDQLEQVYLWQPKDLDACDSSEACRETSRFLIAELTIGGFKRTKLTVPWHYEFNRLLPPHIDLKMPWSWPFPV